MTVEHYAWEKLTTDHSHKLHSHPAHNVSVAEWRRYLGKLPHEQIKARATHGGSVYHPVRINLRHEHVKKLVLGRGIEVHRSQVIGHEHDGQLVLLPSSEAKKLLAVLRPGAKKHSCKLRLAEHHIQHNLIHGGGLFDSFGDFVSGVWDGIKTVGTFVLENGPAILDAIADILPPGSGPLLAAKAALKTAAQVTRQVDGIRKTYVQAQAAKDAAKDKIEAEKQKALEREIALREAGAKKEAIDKAKADAKQRLEKLKKEAAIVGAKAVKEKKELARGQAREKAAAAKAEQKVKKAQEAAAKVQAKK